jgi:hypothetical protein
MSRAILSASALAGLALTAALVSCDSATTTLTDEVRYGLILDACGPADGPAVQILLDRTEYADCKDRHPGELRMLVEGQTLATLKPGQVEADTQANCGVYRYCQAPTVLRIEFRSLDSASVETDFRLETPVDAGTETRSGKAILKKCVEKPMCG